MFWHNKNIVFYLIIFNQKCNIHPYFSQLQLYQKQTIENDYYYNVCGSLMASLNMLYNCNNFYYHCLALQQVSGSFDLLHYEWVCQQQMGPHNSTTHSSRPLQNKNVFARLHPEELQSAIKSPDDFLQLAHRQKWEPIIKFTNQGHLIETLCECWLDQTGLYCIPNVAVFKWMTRLSLRSNNIHRIEVVDLMPQLKELYLNNNKISKIEKLDNLHSLTHLDLGYNKIKKMQNLSNLVNLEDLSLENNQIEVLEGIEKLDSIYSLIIFGNKIQKTDSQIKIVQKILNRKGLVCLNNNQSFRQ